jgi:hypothetical protein
MDDANDTRAKMLLSLLIILAVALIFGILTIGQA